MRHPVSLLVVAGHQEDLKPQSGLDPGHARDSLPRSSQMGHKRQDFVPSSVPMIASLEPLHNSADDGSSWTKDLQVSQGGHLDRHAWPLTSLPSLSRGICFALPLRQANSSVESI